jgi:hypothetical protein
MDKAVEELQQELKLLKNEIKETLTDVREVLLNTVENPFPQDHSPHPFAVHPPSLSQTPPPSTEAAQQSSVVSPEPQAGAGPHLAGNPGSGGPSGIIIGNLGGPPGPGPMVSGAPGLPQGVAGPSPNVSFASVPSDAFVSSAGGPGLVPSARPSHPHEEDVEGDWEAAPEGPRLAPRERGRRRRDQKAPTEGSMRARGRHSRFASQPPWSTDGDEESFERETNDHGVEDRYDEEDEYVEDEEQRPHSRRPKAKVDLVVIASLAPWLTEGVAQLGRKRVKSLLDVYASMGGISTEMKDVLLQVVAMDDTEGLTKSVSIQDTMRFLVELDDLMWRGRQDWRRAALMSMIASGQSLWGPVLKLFRPQRIKAAAGGPVS